ncbi:Methyltransferase domain-containing protein [Parapedobacter composti]|uniref:Methyltransferase domain-containing protein n=1 Tax=Parapedobacter composti TaxID=623281 RepID=A0A1I1EBI8_9SPHI|nr:class I SAM-dependent methyltransferase [Parapedobacter composti]SFB82748.1 Methyltransferase domain-containing protein [Parapedobacter composti]
MSSDSINRFSDRAENYDRFRPGYPPGLVDFIRERIPSREDVVIAEIAAGTGIFTELLARWGNPVYVVEPNADMRQLALRRLAAFKNCTFIEGTAESTGLPDGSVDLIVSAQAFHWFDAAKAKAEFKRIGHGNPLVAIVWNLRNTDSAFESGYESLIRRYSVDYLKVSQRKMKTADVSAFYAPMKPEYRVFKYVDFLTFEQLRGRTLSYSYMPDQSSPLTQEVLASLRVLFEAHQRDGKVRLSYKSRLFIGNI